jgi:uncharacterized protein YukE
MGDVPTGGSQQTVVSVEPIDAMIQKADNLLAEATALGGQYMAHSQDIMGVGWDGDAAKMSLAVAEQVQADLNKAIAANQELHQQLANARAHFLSQQADSTHRIAAVHPGANSG